MVADEFDIDNPGIVRLSLKKMTTFFQLSRQKTVKILRFFDQKAKEKPHEKVSFFAVIDGDRVTINCQKLKDLCDEFTQKRLADRRKSLGSESGVTPVLEAEAEAEAEAEGDLIEDKRKEMHKEKKSLPFQFRLPSDDEILFSAQNKVMLLVMDVGNQLIASGKCPKIFDYIQQKINFRTNPRALLHAMCRLAVAKEVIEKPEGYMENIIKVEDKNFNEKDHAKL